MPQFRIVIGNVATQWFNQAEWTIEDIVYNFGEFPSYEIEYRKI